MRVEHRATPTMKCERKNRGDENDGREKVRKKPKTPHWPQRYRAAKTQTAFSREHWHWDRTVLETMAFLKSYFD